MKKHLPPRSVAIALLMIALAAIVLVASPGVEARGSCNRVPCPQPPPGCVFTGCDSGGACQYDCSGPPV